MLTSKQNYNCTKSFLLLCSITEMWFVLTFDMLSLLARATGGIIHEHNIIYCL